MANKKGYSLDKGFLFDYSWLEMFRSLSPRDAWMLFTEVLEYQKSFGERTVPKHEKKPAMDVMAATVVYQIDKRLKGAKASVAVPTLVPTESRPLFKKEEEEEGTRNKEISLTHSLNAREEDAFPENRLADEPPSQDDIEGETHDREEAKLRYLRGKLGRGIVMLSDEQLDDLLDKLSVEEFDKYVSIVADCELRGKHFTNKTHYRAIIDMVTKDRKKDNGL